MSSLDIIGWTSSALFGFCAAPAAYDCYKAGSTTMSRLFIFMWLAGEILAQVYVYLKHGWDMPLLWNYWLNTFFILVILRYMYFPRKKI